MTTDWLGGGLIIALAAVLWLAYLLPSWFKSRQYLATERNAVRLQQTLRILAETAEMPDEVRVEANARAVAEQQRILKHAAVEREVAAVPPVVRTAERLRRSRAVTAAVFGLSVAVAVLGGMQAVYTGAWVILIGGVVAAFVSLMVLVRLARAGRRLRLPRPVSTPLVAGEFVDHALDDEEAAEDREIEAEVVAEAPRADGWVPVAVPRPLYLSRGRTGSAPLGLRDRDDEADLDYASVDAGAVAHGRAAVADDDRAEQRAALLRAAADSERVLRQRLADEQQTVAELPAAAAPAPATVAPAAPRSRFAAMGIVDDDPASTLNLDDVLARRRAG